MSRQSRKDILRGKSQDISGTADNSVSDPHESDDIDIGSLSANEELLRDLVDKINKDGSNTSGAYDELEGRFKFFLEFKAKKYFIKGGDEEDIKQEGRIGLHKAIRDFDPNRGVGFVSFACMCIDRHLISTIKRGLRYKFEILNESQSLNHPINDIDDDSSGSSSLLDSIRDENAIDPEDNFMAKEKHNVIKDKLFNRLTTMERVVTEEYLRGHSYQVIADKLAINTKSVDNAISRVKEKARSININNL